MILAELEADLLYEMNAFSEALDLGDKLDAALIMAEILNAFVRQARAQLQGDATGGPIQ